MLELVDTHCHIHEANSQTGDQQVRAVWLKDGAKNPDKMIADAKTAGVSRLICVGTTLKDSRLAIELAGSNENCWASIGIHPHEAKDHAGKKVLLEDFSQLVDRPKVVAVGECGLDYFYEHSPRTVQIELLKFQIELALGANLPLIFHVRAAFDDFWPIFESYKSASQRIRGVLHSFTDSRANLERALGHGLYIGVNGIATFTKNPAQAEVYKNIPLENLLLETDAPFLTPVPYRGKINEPKHVRVVAEFLSDLRAERLEQLAMATTTNAIKLFGLE